MPGNDWAPNIAIASSVDVRTWQAVNVFDRGADNIELEDSTDSFEDPHGFTPLCLFQTHDFRTPVFVFDSTSASIPFGGRRCPTGRESCRACFAFRTGRPRALLR